MAKILVIEDDPALSRLYETVLRRSEYEVVLAESGEAAIEAAQRAQPDLVILDLVLPDMPGARVALMLQQQGTLASAPLIVTSGMGEEDTEAVARSFGAASVLTKPFDVGSMLTALRSALEPS